MLFSLLFTALKFWPNSNHKLLIIVNLLNSEFVPRQSIEWLGIVIDTKTLTFPFLNEKILKLKSLLLEALTNNYPVGISLLKVNNKNARTRCEICSKLPINFEHISHLVLVFLLLTFNIYIL